MRFSSITEGFTLTAPATSEIPSVIARSVCAIAPSVVALRRLPEPESFPVRCDLAEAVWTGALAGGGLEAPAGAGCVAEVWLCSVFADAGSSEDVDGDVLG